MDEGDLFTRGLEVIQTTGDHASNSSDEWNRAGLARYTLMRCSIEVTTASLPRGNRATEGSSIVFKHLIDLQFPFEMPLPAIPAAHSNTNPASVTP
jgi:hypothetical protein